MDCALAMHYDYGELRGEQMSPVVASAFVKLIDTNQYLESLRVRGEYCFKHENLNLEQSIKQNKQTKRFAVLVRYRKDDFERARAK